MGVQFPPLNLDEQTQRYEQLAKLTYYPYSYSSFLDGSATNYPNSDVSNITINYNTIAFQADNNMAISAIQILANGRLFFPLNSGKPTTTFIMSISYSPVFKFEGTPEPTGAFPIPTTPSDSGNEILRINQLYNEPLTNNGANQFSFFNVNQYQRFEPYNYLLKYNQFLYINIGFDSSSLAAGTAPVINFSVIFHMLTTGLKI